MSQYCPSVSQAQKGDDQYSASIIQVVLDTPVLVRQNCHSKNLQRHKKKNLLKVIDLQDISTQQDTHISKKYLNV